MPRKSYQIRLCDSCGLRYPLPEGETFGARCPVCLGATHAIATYPLRAEGRVRPHAAFPSGRGRLSALLDNVRSAWNVGAIFRTADGFGLRHVHLCGITPTPEMPALKKTSLSAEISVRWTYHKDSVTTAQELRAGGSRLIALEEDERAIPIQEASLRDERAVLVVGNEVTGVDPELLELCDEILYVPMLGRKKSLNVAVAFAVALSQLVL